MAFIELSRIGKSFPAASGVRPVLRDVSLNVEAGEFVSIVGPMGSGKSTLLGLAAGLIAPDAGTVSIGGEPVGGVRRDTALVFQNSSLLPWLSALENVRLAVEAACPGLSRAEQRRRAQAALEQVGLGAALARRPSQLSGGMRQRVAIARAIATRPKVLLLDEPFGALDALTREALQQEVAQLCAAAGEPVTVLMITNSVEEAILLSDRIVPIVPGPPSTLGAPITVSLPRPRSAARLAQDERASLVRSHVIAALAASMRIARARADTRRAPTRREANAGAAVAEELP